MWWLYLIVLIAGIFIGMVFILAKLPIIGTLYVDMDYKDDKDIARIIFDKSLEEVSRYNIMSIKIEKKKGLSSFDGLL